MLLICQSTPPEVNGELYQNNPVGGDKIETTEFGKLYTDTAVIPTLVFNLCGGRKITWAFLSQGDAEDELAAIESALASAGAGGGGGGTATGELPKLILPIRSVSKTDTTLTADDYTVVLDNAGGNKTIKANLPAPASVAGQVFVVKLTNDPEGNANFSASVETASGNIDGSPAFGLNTAQAAITVQSDGANYHILSRV